VRSRGQRHSGSRRRSGLTHARPRVVDRRPERRHALVPPRDLDLRARALVRRRLRVLRPAGGEPHARVERGARRAAHNDDGMLRGDALRERVARDKGTVRRVRLGREHHCGRAEGEPAAEQVVERRDAHRSHQCAAAERARACGRGRLSRGRLALEGGHGEEGACTATPTPPHPLHACRASGARRGAGGPHGRPLSTRSVLACLPRTSVLEPVASGSRSRGCTLQVVNAGCAWHLFLRYVGGPTLVRPHPPSSPARSRAQQVSGPSMLPTMAASGEVCLEYTLGHRLRGPGALQRGQLVTFASPLDPARIVCKRLAGLPGDVVCVDPTGAKAPSTEHVLVPRDHVWLIGDNAAMSRDSRDYGPVNVGLIRGTLVARVSAPVSPLHGVLNTQQIWPLQDIKVFENTCTPID
jgi:inner membrane protease subunit 1